MFEVFQSINSLITICFGTMKYKIPLTVSYDQDICAKIGKINVNNCKFRQYSICVASCVIIYNCYRNMIFFCSVGHSQL